MLKSKKILLSLVVVTLLAVTFGSLNSLATQEITPSVTAATTNSSTGATISITNATGANTTSNTAATNNATASNNVVSNNTTSNNVVNSVTNKSTYNTTNSSRGSLPYAGTNSTVVFVVIALAISAVYAYKKVQDYNI